MPLEGTEDTPEAVVDPSPLGAPASEEELATEHQVTVTTPAAMSGSRLSTPADIELSIAAVDNKVVPAGVSSEAVTFTPVSTSDKLSNESLNQTAETLKTSVNEKMTALATAATAAIGKVGTDMGAQVTEINNKLSAFKTNIDQAFAQLKVAEGAQNDSVSSEVNRVAGTLMQSIIAVAEGVADAQSKIAALDDVYQTDSALLERITAVNEMVETLRGTDLSALEAVDGVIDTVNGMRRMVEKEVSMSSSTGRFSYNLALQDGLEFADGTEYQVKYNVVGNPQAVAFLQNQTGTGFDIVVKSYGVHFMPQPWDGAEEAVRLAVAVTYDPQAKLTKVVPVLQADLVGTDDVVVGDEPVV
jgi:hypothetical protein